MKNTFKTSASLLTAAAIATSGAVIAPMPARAGSDFLKGVIVGGATVAIINEANKNKKRKSSSGQRVTKKKAVPSGPRTTIATFPTTRDQVRDYQTRLNSLGYNAGTPDGLYGRMTRTAVNDFQASIGAPITGRLSESDAGVLVQRTSQPLMTTSGTLPQYAAAGQPQPTPAFPAPAGAPQQQQAGVTPAFPTYGAAQQPQQAGAAPAFPTIGGATTQQQAPSNTPAFPQVTLPAQGQMAMNAGGSAPANAFAAAGAAPAPAPQPAFPAITQTPAQTATPPAAGAAQPAFPVVQAAAAAPQADGGSSNGANVTVALPTGQPPAGPLEHTAIFDITTGSTLGEARQKLAFEGFSNCEDMQNITHCSTQRDGIQDLVAIQTAAMPDGEIKVGAMSRHLTFAQPMSQEALSSMMADKYAALLAAPNQMTGSENCLTLSDLSAGGRSELTARIMTGDEQSLAGFAASCSHFARIVFGSDGALVNEVSIFVFDGSIFGASTAANQPAKIKF